MAAPRLSSSATAAAVCFLLFFSEPACALNARFPFFQLPPIPAAVAAPARTPAPEIQAPVGHLRFRPRSRRALVSSSATDASTPDVVATDAVPDITIPACATSCIADAVLESTTCDVGEYDCECQSTNAQKIEDGAALCVDQACGYVSAVSAWLSADLLCQSVLVGQYSVPGVSYATDVGAFTTPTNADVVPSATGAAQSSTRRNTTPTGAGGAATSSGTSSGSNAGALPATGTGNSLAKGAIAGIAVGSAVGAALLCGLAFFLYRCLRRDKIAAGAAAAATAAGAAAGGAAGGSAAAGAAIAGQENRPTRPNPNAAPDDPVAASGGTPPLQPELEGKFDGVFVTATPTATTTTSPSPAPADHTDPALGTARPEYVMHTASPPAAAGYQQSSSPPPMYPGQPQPGVVYQEVPGAAHAMAAPQELHAHGYNTGLYEMPPQQYR